MTPVLLVAHGSAYPAAAATIRALARGVAAARPGIDVRVAFLDHAGPRPAEVLAAFDRYGHRSAVMVPLLLTSAYHDRVDLPAVLASARRAGLRLEVATAAVLGPGVGGVPAALLDGLTRRLAETGAGYDAVLLAAAGTRDAMARSTVAEAAVALGAALGVSCIPGYASAAEPTGAEAVAALRAAGARRVAVAAYFLACGRLYDTVIGSALTAGAVAAATPLGACRELVRLVLQRVAVVDPGGHLDATGPEPISIIQGLAA